MCACLYCSVFMPSLAWLVYWLLVPRQQWSGGCSLIMAATVRRRVAVVAYLLSYPPPVSHTLQQSVSWLSLSNTGIISLKNRLEFISRPELVFGSAV